MPPSPANARATSQNPCGGSGDLSAPERPKENPGRFALAPLRHAESRSTSYGTDSLASRADSTLLESLSDGAPSFVSHLGPTEHRLSYLNDAALDLLEYRREELVGMSPSALFARGPGVEAFAYDLLQGIPVQEVVTVQSKGGRWYRAHLTATPTSAPLTPITAAVRPAAAITTTAVWALADVIPLDHQWGAPASRTDHDLISPSPPTDRRDRARRDLWRHGPGSPSPRHAHIPPSRRLSSLRLDTADCQLPPSPSHRAAPATVLYVASDLTVVSCGAGCKALFGYGVLELTGKPLSLLLAPSEDGAVWQWGARPRVLTGLHQSHSELHLVAQAGAAETLGGRECIAVSFADITDLPGVQQLLRDQRADLQQYRQFVHFVFHEVKQPLSVLLLGLDHIAGSCSRLSTEGGTLHHSDELLSAYDDPVEDVLATTQDLIAAAHTMHRLLADVLTLEKLDHNKMPIEPTSGRLGDIVTDAHHRTAALFREKGIRVRAEVDPMLATVDAQFDHCRLQQVMMNLLTNAQKFTPPGGRVRIGMDCLALDNDRVELEVRVEDSGVGVAEAVRPQLFRPFVQHRPTELQGGGGTGLGLAISKGIIAAHGGTIGVRSNTSNGAEFWFRLNLPRRSPTADPPAPKSPTSRPAHVPRPPARRSSLPTIATPPDVLVVDDQPLNRKYLQKMIVREGLSVAVAASGEEVLQRFTAGERWRLILTDYTMHEMDGAQLTLGLHTLGCDAPIVGITGSHDAAEAQALLAAGAKEICPKPFRSEDVQRCLRTYLAVPTSRRQGSPFQFPTPSPRPPPRAL